ncbi:MAG: DUF3108 domain-containing protein [Saprospiraceae bacterium]|nr:DUF3108 domain-containing protein [Saprospiraceae bacterium]
MMVKFLISVLLVLSVPYKHKDMNVPEKYSNEDICRLTNTTFKAGEKLTYKIYYNWGLLWMPAGNVTFTVKEKGDQYILKAVGKTYNTYNWFYEVEDYFYSHVDKVNLLPSYAKRDIDEGGFKILNEINFDQKAGKAFSYLKVNKKEPQTLKKEFETCMMDILSLVYKLRNLDTKSLKIKDKVVFSMMLDDEIYDLNFEYLGKDSAKKINGMGVFKTFKISPAVIKGRVFDQEERMTIWISDDNAKVPLSIESPLAIGTVKVILQKHENLLYPLNKISD